MVKFSRVGKPLCSRCQKVATHTIHATLDGHVAYSYQCVGHRHASSKLLTSAHIEGLSLDQRFYHRHLFVAWLACNPDMMVGCTADECQCPLAHFYSYYYGQPCLVAFSGQVQALSGGGRVFCCLSAWAKAFTLAVDFTHPDTEITGQQALDLLEKKVLARGCNHEPAC